MKGEVLESVGNVYEAGQDLTNETREVAEARKRAQNVVLRLFIEDHLIVRHIVNSYRIVEADGIEINFDIPNFDAFIMLDIVSEVLGNIMDEKTIISVNLSEYDYLHSWKTFFFRDELISLVGALSQYQINTIILKKPTESNKQYFNEITNKTGISIIYV